MDIFDEKDALERTAGDRMLLAEVIRFTLNDIPGIIEGIDRALKAGEWMEVSRLAHKAKGSAGACGARNLYLSTLDLELAGRDGDVLCAAHLPSIVEAFEAFRSHPGVREIASLDAGAEASIG